VGYTGVGSSTTQWDILELIAVKYSVFIGVVSYSAVERTAVDNIEYCGVY
jgi:hypothetical protein